ncbi:helix-turn-helix domain-containing protein [Streptomyces venezuelae]|uniref:XRE family transcriptional regulator n=1 Tax=Streptomyces venezuelae TaxID=54571 RepID=A0A5P2BBX2_STRVZ|nr:helix-turn-helix transcriptional regulator [Streptomyces venezuelae]QES25829.1 XRE family transcriptional regulator [Streptomyces venezuelae]
MTEQPAQPRRPRPSVEHGPTAQAVAANVRRMRKRRSMSTYELSAVLTKMGRPIAASAIAKLERGERQVNVDELMVLACALRTPPSALLLPPDDSPDAVIEITGVGTVSADAAWDWVDGKRPLNASERFERPYSHERLEHTLYSRPPLRGEKEVGCVSS